MATSIHTFGSDISTASSVEEMLSLMGANWRSELEEVQTKSGRDLPNNLAIVRSDTGAPIGVVSKHYNPVSNEDLFAPLFTLIQRDPNLKLATGGVLDGGRTVFARVTLGNPEIVGRPEVNDLVRCYVGIVASHDGTGSSRVMLQPMRLRCRNGLTVTHRRARASIVHRGGKDAIERQVVTLKGVIEDASKAWMQAREIFGRLTEARVPGSIPTQQLIRTYAAAVFGREEIKAQEAGNFRRANALQDAYLRGEGADMETAEGTGWGLYNALTHYITHSRKIDDRRFSALLGTDVDRKSRRGIDVAYALAVKRYALVDVLDHDSPAMLAVANELAMRS